MNDHSRQALVGAIGRAYISLAVADIDELTVSNFALLNTPDFDNPMQAVERYLASIPRCPNKVGLAVAGDVAGDAVQMSYKNWTITKNDVRAATGADHVTFVNDFEAVALSLPHLTDYDLHTIVPGHPAPYANRVVIAAGTGLGVAGLIHAGEDWLPVRGEGGHVAFGAQPAGEFDVRTAFAPDAFVSADDVFSGRGLVALYSALARSKSLEVASPGARKIAQMGLAREDAVAVETLDLMATWLGRFAGDMALIYGARGGVYLAGGLASNIIPALETGRFRDAFEAKGPFGAYLGGMPVHAIKTGADAGLRGAAVALARSLPSRTLPQRRVSDRV
ncbi:MAG: glucokinase [Devosia sp.]|nr:glucokinase [Devosia sp.]